MAEDWKKPISDEKEAPAGPSASVAKKKPTTPWKPASVLAGVKPRPGYRGRWTRSDLVEKRKLEGWEVVPAQGEQEKTIIDGGEMGSFTKGRNLVWMEIPEELAKAREEYYKRLSDGAIEANVEEFENVAKQQGAGSYGTIKIERGEEVDGE